MARTKQSARRSMPSHDDVAAALVVAMVPMTHKTAPTAPILSAQRSKFALDWVSNTYGGHFFHHPVDWRALGLMDYPAKISHPMDLETLKAYTDDSATFCFATMLDRTRVIWANACLYNGDRHPVADVARRIAALFEAKIIELQQHPVDDDAAAVTNVMMPVLNALMEEDTVDPFVEPVDLEFNPSYPNVVDHGMCLEEVESRLDGHAYSSRYDFATDVLRVFDNAVKFNGKESTIGTHAAHLRDMFGRIFAACVRDVECHFVLTCDMRIGLHDNLYRLSNANRLTVMQKMRDDKCLSIRDESDGDTMLSINMMCMAEFMSIDTFVRMLLVAQTDEDHPSHSEEEWEESEHPSHSEEEWEASEHPSHSEEEWGENE